MMKEKNVIFEQFIGLKKHHQVIFSLLILLGVLILYSSHKIMKMLAGE